MGFGWDWTGPDRTGFLDGVEWAWMVVATGEILNGWTLGPERTGKGEAYARTFALAEPSNRSTYMLSLNLDRL